MRTHGTIVRWNSERGFGFVRPAGQTRDVFVHISELGKTGRPPQVGELISFDIQQHEGKPRAVNIRRTAAMERVTSAASRPAAPRRPTSPPVMQWLIYAAIALIAVAFAASYADTLKQWWPGQHYSASSPPATSHTRAAAAPAPAASYECGGRTHCKQMRSCAEATWVLRNCPGTQMDGDGDGIPCEQQWCN